MQIRILVVDDEQDQRNLAVQVLSSILINGIHNLIVDTANDGNEAWLKHSQQPYDLFLSDLQMPGMDGVELLRKLHPHITGTKVIIVSGQQDFEEAKEIIRCGAYDYISKPYAVDALLKSVSEAILNIVGEKNEAARVDSLKMELGQKDGQVKLLTLITENERNRFRIILDSIEEGLIAFDTGELLVMINKQACNLLGLNEAACIGMSLPQVISDPIFISSVKEAGFDTRGFKWYEKDGRVYKINNHPIMEQDSGNKVGFIVVISEKTSEINASLIRQNFLSIVAHELRTPLTVMQNGLFLLEHNAQRVAELIPELKETIHAMNFLTGRLIKVALYAGPDVPVERERTDIVATVFKVFAKLQPEADARQIDLSIDKPDRPVIIKSDNEKITVMLENLLHNAIKFNRVGGRTNVSVAYDGRRVSLRIVDQGAGIPEDFLPRLFNVFLQAENNLSRSYSGVGVGLFLVKRIVSLLGGKIDIVSKSGLGTTVNVQLPAG